MILSRTPKKPLRELGAATVVVAMDCDFTRMVAQRQSGSAIGLAQLPVNCQNHRNCQRLTILNYANSNSV
jgi:hypothetical protein